MGSTETVGLAGNIPWHVCDKAHFSTALEEALVGVLLKAKFMGAAAAFWHGQEYTEVRKDVLSY